MEAIGEEAVIGMYKDAIISNSDLDDERTVKCTQEMLECEYTRGLYEWEWSSEKHAIKRMCYNTHSDRVILLSL